MFSELGRPYGSAYYLPESDRYLIKRWNEDGKADGQYYVKTEEWEGRERTLLSLICGCAPHALHKYTHYLEAVEFSQN